MLCVDAADDASIVNGATVGEQFGSGGGDGPGPGCDVEDWLTTNGWSAAMMTASRGPPSLALTVKLIPPAPVIAVDAI